MVKDKQERVQSSQGEPSKSIGQLLVAMVHIVTTAYINRSNKDNNFVPGRGDYLRVVSWFVGLSILTALATSLGSYVVLLVSEKLFQTMMIATLPLLYQLIIFKTIAEVGSAAISFALDYYKNQSDNAITLTTRNFMDTFISRRKFDYKQYNLAQRESLPQVVGHITAIINFTVFVIVYGVYALSHLNPSQLLLASITGAISIILNKGISCQFDAAHKKDIVANAEVYAERTLVMSNLDKTRQIGAWNWLKNILRLGNQRIYESSRKKRWYAGLLDLSANVVKSITENLFLIQFAILIAYGVVSPLDVVILMPYIKNVSEACGKLVMLDKLTTMVGRQITILSDVWNDIMPNGLKVPDKSAITQTIKTYHIIIYSLTLGVILPTTLPIFTSVSAKALSFILLVWPMTVKLWPEFLTSQLFMQIVTTLEYPFVSVKSVRKILEKVKSSNIMPNALIYKVSPTVSLSFSCDQLKEGKPLKVNAANGRGKTTIFVECASAYSGTMCITAVEANKSFEEISDWYELNDKEKEIITQKSKELMSGIKLDRLSSGGRELLNVLAAAHCASKRDHCSYICFDEALNYVDPKLRGKIYEYLTKVLKKKKVVYIDHAANIKCRQAELKNNAFCVA